MIALAFFINFTSSSHHFFGYARAIKSPNPTTQSSIITRSIVYRFTFSTLHFKTCTLLPRQIVHCKITTMKMKIIPSNASSLSSLCELCVVVAAAASDAAVFKFCLKIMFLFDYRKPNKKISESKWRAEKRISMHFLVWIFFAICRLFLFWIVCVSMNNIIILERLQYYYMQLQKSIFIW